MRIFLIGFMGAGKSYWGVRLSEISGLKYIDLDQCIEEHSSQKISALFEEMGENGFRELEKKMLHEILSANDDFIMACGGGTPCFYNNLELMKQKGKVIWLNPSLSTILHRLVSEKSNRPLLRNLNDKQLEQFVSSTLASREKYYSQADLMVPEEMLDPADLLKKIGDV